MTKILPLRPRLLELERAAVGEALEATNGDVRAASALLGVPERTLWHRIRGPLALDPSGYRCAKNADRAKSRRGKSAQ